MLADPESDVMLCLCVCIRTFWSRLVKKPMLLSKTTVLRSYKLSR